MATTLFWQSKPVSAAPVLGGQLFATGNDVQVQVMPASAGFTSELWLFEPIGSRRRIATNRDVGLVVDLGTFPQGTELVFGIHVLNTGDDFRMGVGSRNADGQIHDQVDFLEAGKAQVGFEDLFGGGDRDYNDNVFEFRGGIAPEVPKGPTADAGPDQQVTEGDVVTLDATGSSDPDSPNLTYLWAPAGASGPPITLSSATSATPSFQTADDGVYRFTLSVSDGTETDTDEVKVTVGNAPPVIATQADPAYEGGVALVTSQFTDPGFLDTHQAVIDWNDGTPSGTLTVNEGSGWGSAWGSHVYAHAGRYAVTVTVTDDDGGRDTSHTSTVDVIAAPALWANSSSTDAAMESTSGKITVYGLTHTNDDLRLRGDVKTFHGPVEYARTLDSVAAGPSSTCRRSGPPSSPSRSLSLIADYRPGGPVSVEVGAAYHDQSASCGSDRTSGTSSARRCRAASTTRTAVSRSTVTRSAAPSRSSPKVTSP